MAGVSGWKTRLVDDTDVPTPPAGKVHLFWDLADGQPKYKDETGAVNTFPSLTSFNGRTGAVVPLQADYDSFFLTAAEGATLITAHEAAGDPHSQYLTAAEGNAAYQPVDSDLTAIAALSTTSFGRALLALAAASDLAALVDSFFLTAAEGNAAYQPLDATLTALAAVNWAANALAIGTGADTLSQTAFAANTFPGRSSAGNLVAKSMTDAGFAWNAAADVAAETALLNVATTALKGLQSAADKKKEDAIWFDIVADGGADPTGVADIATILTNAIAAVSTTVGGCIYFPTGIYRLASAITVDKEIIFRGNGRNNTFIELSSATANGFNLTTNNIGFENLRIWTTAASPTLRTAGAAINMDNGSAFPSNINNCYVKDCDILFQWTAIIMGGHLCWIDNCNIRECGANAANGAGILVQKFGDRYIRRITTDNPSNPTGFAWIRVTEGSSLVIDACNLIHGTNCLDLVPGASQVIPSLYCSNTFFDTSVIGANFAGNASGTIHRVKFNQCWFSTMTTAGAVLNQANTTGLDFINCDFYDNTTFGIQAIAATDWAVRSSRIAGNDTAGIRTTAGAAHSFTIADCFVGNCSGFGANAIGIDILAGTYKRYQILDNRGLESNTTAGISDLGVVGPTDQKDVQNNLGALVTGKQQPLSSGGAAAIVARGAVTSGTGETFLMTFRIPANSVSVGQVFRLTVFSMTSGAGAVTWAVKLGTAGTVAGDTTNCAVVQAIQAANVRQTLLAYVTVVALGASNTLVANGHAMGGTTSTGVWIGETLAAEVIASVATTGAWFITLTCTCSVGTCTVQQAILEAI